MRFELPDQKKLVLDMVIPLRWGDMDAMGHVNNVAYFRYLEILRIEWMYRSIGAADPNGSGIVVANVFCNFLRQLTFPGDLRARLFVANPGRSSFDSFATLERSDEPGVVYANGGATVVWMDFASGKSAPLPEPLRALIG
jgi:acyl-CoA thioester hydrolase